MSFAEGTSALTMDLDWLKMEFELSEDRRENSKS